MEDPADYTELPPGYQPPTEPISPTQPSSNLLEDGELSDSNEPTPPMAKAPQPWSTKHNKTDIRHTRFRSNHLSKDGRFCVMSALSQYTFTHVYIPGL